MELPFLPTNIATEMPPSAFFSNDDATYYADLHLLKIKTRIHAKQNIKSRILLQAYDTRTRKKREAKC